MPNPADQPTQRAPLGLRTVALYECAKGLLVLLAGVGALLLIHRDTQQMLVNAIHNVGLNPEWYYLHLLVDESGKLTDEKKWLFALVAGFYSLTRFIITHGLWHERHWAEWFAVISACVYFPFEVLHFIRKPMPSRLIIPIFNVLVVIYLVRVLMANRRKRKAARDAAEAKPGGGA
jgi:uncharacterized membrane protein (DUF2068 family)